jgi:hypothetical protein
MTGSTMEIMTTMDFVENMRGTLRDKKMISMNNRRKLIMEVNVICIKFCNLVPLPIFEEY